MKEVRTRFAPSPTGYLHIGGLRTALYGYLYAKKEGGKFILRLEDTDTSRYVEDSVSLIYNTLKDSGVIYAEGPDVGGNYGPYVQSQRKDIYKKYAELLVERGGAYYCFCDEERIASLKDGNGVSRYDKHCLSLTKEEIQANIAAGKPYVIRQNIPLTGSSSYTDLVYGEITVENKDMEDGILLKSDGMPTYNFANVVDDHLMAISHVIRGTEYLSSTPKYNHMYDCFGWERPVYIHLPPIMKDEHQKLSKRNGDASYQDLVDKGYIKEAIINYIALLGWSPKSNQEKFSLQELEEKFSLEGISKSPSIFDPVKLGWLSGEYIKDMAEEDYFNRALPFLQKSKAYGKGYDEKKLLLLVKTRIETLAEIPAKLDFLQEFGDFDNALYTHKKMKTDESVAKAVLPEIIRVIEAIPEEEYTFTRIHDDIMRLPEALAMKNGQVLWPMRVALSGKETTPGGAFELADILGKEESLKRLNFSLNRL